MPSLNFIKSFLTTKALSDREVEVCFELIRANTTLKGIGERLSISESTVNNHLTSIFKKLGVKSKSELLSQIVIELTKRLDKIQGSFRAPRVLIVDDEADICDFLVSTLTDRGMVVFATTHPDKTEFLIEAHHIDFVVSDIDMPGMDGFAMLKKLREKRPYYPLAVFITGNSEHLKEQVFQYGAMGIIEKPIDIIALFNLILRAYVEELHERDRTVRVNGDFLVDLTSSTGNESTCRNYNIGLGGMFVEFTQPDLKEGQTVKLKFKMEPIDAPVEITGEVVWVRESRKEDLPAGVGIKFLRLNPELRARLAEYIRIRKILNFIPIGN